MKFLKNHLRICLLLTALLPAPVFSLPAEIRDSKVIEIQKFKDVVWGFDFFDEENVLLTLRGGEIHHLNLKSKKTRLVSGGPVVVAAGQGGLMDLRLHREGKKIWVYLTASVRPELGTEKEQLETVTTGLFRGEWVGSVESGSLQKLSRLFEAQPGVDSPLHFGSRLAIHKDGSLYLSLGERNERERAQDLQQHWGKILRLKLDGTPFRSSSIIAGSRIEMHSYGHRNPQGIGIHPASGDIFVVEHGPRGGDEINLVKGGANFGWPTVSFGREYSGPAISKSPLMAGVEAPIKYYVPSIAPSSLHFYSGKRYSQLKDRLLIGALALQHLNIVELKAAKSSFVAVGETRVFEKLGERIRSVNESPLGEIYMGTDSGRFLRAEFDFKP